MYEQNRFLSRFIFIIKALPCYLLIIFGCFCLGKLGYDLISFNDLPSEVHKLEEVYPSLFSRIKESTLLIFEILGYQRS